MKLINALRQALSRLMSNIAQNAQAAVTFGAELIRAAFATANYGIHNRYTFECYDSEGNLKWVEVIDNLVVNVGLDDILDKYWKGSAYTAAHYVGLTDGAPVTIAAGDTMLSHAGWSEVVPYSDANRPALTMGTVSGQSVNNSAAKASYSINATATVGGAFVSTDNTKSGTAGTLVGGGAFTGGDKGVASGDTLNVTITSTATSS